MNREKTTHLLMAREQRSRREVEMMQNASLEKRGIDEALTQEMRGLNVGVLEGGAYACALRGEGVTRQSCRFPLLLSASFVFFQYLAIPRMLIVTPSVFRHNHRVAPSFPCDECAQMFTLRQQDCDLEQVPSQSR